MSDFIFLPTHFHHFQRYDFREWSPFNLWELARIIRQSLWPLTTRPRVNINNVTYKQSFILQQLGPIKQLEQVQVQAQMAPISTYVKHLCWCLINHTYLFTKAPSLHFSFKQFWISCCSEVFSYQSKNTNNHFGNRYISRIGTGD